MSFNPFKPRHRHKVYEDTIIELAGEISELKSQFATLRARVAVHAREAKKERNPDLTALGKLFGGEVVGEVLPDGSIRGIDNELAE